jgi:hypothetical protein
MLMLMFLILIMNPFGKIMSKIMIMSRRNRRSDYFFVQSSVTFFTRSLHGSLISVKCSVFFERIKL